jgi:hypothetical protein
VVTVAIASLAFNTMRLPIDIRRQLVGKVQNAIRPLKR